MGVTWVDDEPVRVVVPVPRRPARQVLRQALVVLTTPTPTRLDIALDECAARTRKAAR